MAEDLFFGEVNRNPAVNPRVTVCYTDDEVRLWPRGLRGFSRSGRKWGALMKTLVTFVVLLTAFVVMFKLYKSVEAKEAQERSENKLRPNPVMARMPGWMRTVILLTIIFGGYYLLAKGVISFGNKSKDNNAKKEAEIVSIEEDYKALNEDNTDAETGKKILTEKFLKKEYEIFCVKAYARSRGDVNLALVGLYIIVGFGALIVVPYCIGAFYKKYRSIRTAVIYLAIIAAVLFGGKYALKATHVSYRIPDPKKDVSFEVFEVTAQRYSSEYEDSDGDTHYSQSVSIDFGDGKVWYKGDKSSYLYTSIGDPGRYYLARAEGNGKTCDFKCFSVEKYVSEEDADA
ncbi:MAG: hypothetical protein J6040_05945 [Clostridiales bacterium]|nr:hypothetical protein [Clostridiales bacterium]